MAEELIAEPIAEETIETPVAEETAEPIEGEESAESAGEELPAEEVAGDGRVVPAKYRELFKADKELKSLFFENREFKNAFPGGVNEAKEILTFFAEKGGKDGIVQLATQLHEAQAVDQALIAGNSKEVLDRVRQISPDAVSKLAPDVLQAYATDDPDGCNQMLCGVVANSISQSGIPQQLYEASLALKYGQHDEAARLIGEISKGLNGFSERASTPVAPKGIRPDAKLTERETQLNQREEQIYTSQYNSQVQSYFEPAVSAEAKNAGYGNLSERQLSMLNREVAIAADKAVGDATLKLIAAARGKKDTDGAIKLIKSRYAEVLPEVVKREARELFGSPVGKAAPKLPVVAPKPVVVPKAAVNERGGSSAWAERFQKAITA